MFAGVVQNLLLRRIQSLIHAGNGRRRVQGPQVVFRMNRATCRTGVMADGQLDQMAVPPLVTQLDHMKAAARV